MTGRWKLAHLKSFKAKSEFGRLVREPSSKLTCLNSAQAEVEMNYELLEIMSRQSVYEMLQ